MSSQNSPGNSPSLFTPPSPREDHNNDENSPLRTPITTTTLGDFLATAPDFLAPADFGNPASAATTTTRVLESSPPTLTDLDRILAAISGINACLDNQNADINVGVYIVMVCPWTDHILARNPLLEVEADLS
jgi:hypothetical protein